MLRKTKYLFPILLLGIAGVFPLLSYVPVYTKWAVVLLVLPSIFFLLRKESVVDLKKVAVLAVLGIILGLIWDHAAISQGIWDFPKESVAGWFLGIPFEEYIFAVCFPIIIVGFYTSLPRFRVHVWDGPRVRELPLLLCVFLLQGLTFLWIFFSNTQTYLQWLLLLAIFPSIFYIWRKGEKIDEVRMLVTSIFLAAITYVTDVVFIASGCWVHFDRSLIGRVGTVPVDDILFSVFIGITIVGLYTSLPEKNMLRGKW